MKRFAIILSFCVAVSLLIVGCGGQKTPDGFPKIYPTTVTVTVDGKPTEGAAVTLIPGTASNWPIAGVTDATGVAIIRTGGEYVGAPEGEMTVCIVKKTEDLGPRAATPPTPDEDLLERNTVITRETTITRDTPAEYADAGTSPLKMTVKAGKNAETFDVPFDGTVIKQGIRE